MALKGEALSRELWRIRTKQFNKVLANGGITEKRHPDREPRVYKLTSAPMQRSKRPWEK